MPLLESIISKLATSKFSIFQLVSVAQETGLSLALSETQKTGFVVLIPKYSKTCHGFFQQLWEKAPGQNWEIMIDLSAKLGETNNIEHNKGSKIYPQNQAFLDCKICQPYHLSTSV